MSRLTIVVTTILSVSALGVAWYWFASRSEVTNFPSSGTDIIAFGDSLVSGAGASKGNDFISVLSRKIGQPIVNLGVPGNTTADGLARIKELDAYDPKVVIVLLGGNDYLKRVPEETTFENLSRIIEYVHSKGAIVLLLGVKGSFFGDRFSAEFDALSEKYQTAFVSNVLEGLFGNPNLMSDQIHPNDSGYRIIADRVYPVLVSLLK